MTADDLPLTPQDHDDALAAEYVLGVLDLADRIAVESRAGGKQVTMESTIEIEGKDRPACVAESIGIIYGE